MQFHVFDAWIHFSFIEHLRSVLSFPSALLLSIGTRHLGYHITNESYSCVNSFCAISFFYLGNFVAQYHLSTLKPWRRHPSPKNIPTANHPNLIAIHTADQFKSILDSRTRIHSAAQSYHESSIFNSSLVVLYYSRTCGLSTHGDSLTWHFESAARSLAGQPNVTFARLVDLVQLIELIFEDFFLPI